MSGKRRATGFYSTGQTNPKCLDVRDRMETFIFDYNHNRPHDSLGNQTPMQHYQKHESLSL